VHAVSEGSLARSGLRDRVVAAPLARGEAGVMAIGCDIAAGVTRHLPKSDTEAANE